MKKISSLVVFSFLITNLIFAQAPIPNASFETWTSGEPNGWGTSDGILVGFGQPDPGTVEQDTAAANVYAGSSSVRLTNKHVITPFGAQDIPGVINLGTITFDIQTFMPTLTGYAYTDRPDSIRLAAKYTSGPTGTDTGNVAVTLTKWTANGRIVVGNARIPVADVATFNVFRNKIVYHSALAPDTLMIQAIATSSQSSVLDSKLWVDDLSFIGLDTAFKAYINPGFDLDGCVGDTVNFRTDNIPNNTYQWVKDGVPVPGGTQSTLDASHSGSYYVQVTAGGTVYTSDTVDVTLHAAPVVTYTVPAAQDTLCLNSTPVALTGGTPSGGMYSGDGVDSTGHFHPTVIGANSVSYSVTNNFGCRTDASQTIWVRVCTGIEMLEDGLNLNIYPNPASSFVIVESDQKLIGGSIEVYDALGNLVATETITATKSNLSIDAFASGIYNLRLFNSAKKPVANAKISVAH